MDTLNKLVNIAIGLLFVVGLGILCYPTFSNYYNKLHSSRAVATYREQVANVSGEAYDLMFQEAREYNQLLYAVTQEEDSALSSVYKSCLDVHNGMMGYIEIPKIGVSLPIYHGTTENVLQKYVGHLDWTSMPTGDIGNHTVLTGHTGLPSAKLFTDLDQLVLGDGFQLNILDETFYYEVTEILVVEPHKVDSLTRDLYKDKVTLVTCTPYGINSHRLLVQGERQFQSVSTGGGIWDGLTNVEGGGGFMNVLFPVLMVGIVIAIVVVIVRERRNRY